MQSSTGLAVFYAVIGASFFVRLSWTIVSYPLVPFRTDDANWSMEWVLTTIGDYYTVTACFCGVVLGTEELLTGLLWCAGLLVGVGPVASCYVIATRFRGLSVQLERSQESLAKESAAWTVAAVVAGVVGVASMAFLLWQLFALPLLPAMPEDAPWASGTLIVAVVDYYSVAVCFSILAMATDGLIGVLWGLAVLILGAPFGCAYILYHILRGSPLRLARDSSGEASQSLGDNE